LEGLQEQLDDETLLEDLTILEIEINELEEEKALLQDAKNKAITHMATANKKYRSMRMQQGKNVDSFAYQLGRCLQ
jgi:FtsZ-binding cell division protein ZapB